MSIVASTTTTNTPAVCFATPPWHEQHPERLLCEHSLPPDHLARSIEATVQRLDLSDLYATYAGTGSQPFRPDLLLRAVLFETRRGHHSPATWYRDAHESGPVRWLLRGCTPTRSVWYAFRDRLAPLLDDLNAQPLHAAVEQHFTPATHAATDGTLVAANASRHRLLNAAKLDQRATQLDAAVAADDHGQTPAEVPAWMAKQPASRKAQQRRFRRGQEEMAKRHARNAGKRPSKQTRANKVVLSVSDSEAAVGLDKEKVFRPLYNVQVVDDLHSPFILGYEVFAQPNDAGLLGTMAQRTQKLVGHSVAVMLTDTAYAGGADLKAASAAGVTVYAPLPQETTGKAQQVPKSAFVWLAEEQTYVCPQGHRLVSEGRRKAKRSGPEHVVVERFRCPPEHCVRCPLRELCAQQPASGRTVSRSENEAEVEALRVRMATEAAQALYKQRRQSVELVNADWKGHRQLRRFSGRGLARARCQVGLIVLVHNLLTLLAQEKKAKAAADAASPMDIAT